MIPNSTSAKEILAQTKPEHYHCAMNTETRRRAIEKWCYTNGVRQVYAFFRPFDPSLENHYHRIRRVLGNGTTKPVDADDGWIMKIESAIETIEQHRSKAA